MPWEKRGGSAILINDCLSQSTAKCYPRAVNRNIFYIIGVIVVIIIVLKVLNVF
jgi:hypothetical protein